MHAEQQYVSSHANQQHSLHAPATMHYGGCYILLYKPGHDITHACMPVHEL